MTLRRFWSLLLKEWTEKIEDKQDNKERKVIESGRKLVELDDMKPRKGGKKKVSNAI